MPILIAILAGCSQDTTCAAGFALTREGYCDPIESTSPVWSFSDATAAIEGVFEVPFSGPVELRAAYLEQMSFGDESCPGSDIEISDSFVTGCTASTGYYFAGVAIYETQYSKEENFQMWAIGGDFEIKAPTGEQMLVGGHSVRVEGVQNNFFNGDITGSWSLDGAGGWLGEGISAMLILDSMSYNELTIYGGLTVGSTALYFPHLHWESLECSPSGEIQVRDQAGHWFDLFLADDCSGCGTMTYDAHGMSEEVCIDFNDIGQTIYNSMTLQ